jgi:hypothetical protein
VELDPIPVQNLLANAESPEMITGRENELEDWEE